MTKRCSDNAPKNRPFAVARAGNIVGVTLDSCVTPS